MMECFHGAVSLLRRVAALPVVGCPPEPMVRPPLRGRASLLGWVWVQTWCRTPCVQPRLRTCAFLCTS
jgi:hypothetical protein